MIIKTNPKPKKFKLLHLLLLALLLMILAIPFRRKVRRCFVEVVQTVRGKHTVRSRVTEFKTKVHKSLLPEFKKQGVNYPPEEIILNAMKEEKKLELWAPDNKGKIKHIKTYPILGASGKSGPKLKEGDAQVPEGIYKIESLNPNSVFHLSLRLNYPNEFDIEKGKEDNRIGEDLGSDIMIHGRKCSVGCLAMGDPAIEELFILCAETGIDNVKVIISPVNLRIRNAEIRNDQPRWLPELYEKIKTEQKKL